MALVRTKFWQGQKLGVFQGSGWNPSGFTVQFTLSVLPNERPTACIRASKAVATSSGAEEGRLIDTETWFGRISTSSLIDGENFLKLVLDACSHSFRSDGNGYIQGFGLKASQTMCEQMISYYAWRFHLINISNIDCRNKDHSLLYLYSPRTRILNITHIILKSWVKWTRPISLISQVET